MTRSKAAMLGLAALALVALSALVVSGAQGRGANNYEITCLENDSLPHVDCYGEGHQARRHGSEVERHEFNFGIAIMHCANVTTETTTDADGTDPEPEATPLYSGCTDSTTNEEATVTHNECEFKFHIEKQLAEPKTGEVGDEFQGSMDVVCPPEKVIEIHLATKCTLTIAPQETVAPIYFRNMTDNTHIVFEETTKTPTDITVEAVNAEVHTVYHGGFTKCFKLANPATGFSKLSGNTTVEFFNSADEQIDAQID